MEVEGLAKVAAGEVDTLEGLDVGLGDRVLAGVVWAAGPLLVGFTIGWGAAAGEEDDVVLVGTGPGGGGRRCAIGATRCNSAKACCTS